MRDERASDVRLLQEVIALYVPEGEEQDQAFAALAAISNTPENAEAERAKLRASWESMPDDVKAQVRTTQAIEGQPDAFALACGLCGKPMPPGEEMFKYHGYSGPCPTSDTPPSTNYGTR